MHAHRPDLVHVLRVVVPDDVVLVDQLDDLRFIARVHHRRDLAATAHVAEAHPVLSTTDEFADFETYDHLIAAEGAKSEVVFGDAFLAELRESDRDYIKRNPERYLTVKVF